MPFLPRSLKWRTILFTLVGLLSIGLSVWATWGRDIEFAIREQMAIHENQLRIRNLREDQDPVMRGLARGEIRAGDSVEELIAAHPPERVARHERYVELEYSFWLKVVAKDGQLVMAVLRGAGACSPSTVFFNHLTANDELAIETWASNQRFAERQMCHQAVGGGMALLPPPDLFNTRPIELSNLLEP